MTKKPIKIRIEKAFGIRDSIEFSLSKDNKTIIFGPNGSGKSSIRKIFEQLSKKEFSKFGMEEDGGPNSLLINGNNMASIQNNEVLVIKNQCANNEDTIKERIIKTFLIKEELFSKLKEKYKELKLKLRRLWDEEIEKELEDFYFSEELSNIFDADRLEKEYEEYENLFFKNNISLNTKDLFKKNNLDIIRQLSDLLETCKDTKGNAKEELQTMQDDFFKIVELQNILDKMHLLPNSQPSSFSGSSFLGNNSIFYKYSLISRIFTSAYGVATNKNSLKHLYKSSLIAAGPMYPGLGNAIALLNRELRIRNLTHKEGWKLIDNWDLIKKYFDREHLEVNKINTDFLNEKIKEKEKKFFVSILRHYEMPQLFKEFYKSIEEFIKSYNTEVVPELNNLINKNKNLIWKIELEEINDINEIFKYKVYFWDNKKESSFLESFASTGQKNIILFAIQLAGANNLYDYIIIDDVFSSMDSDNVFIAVDLIANIKKPLIVLTHNYWLLNRIYHNSEVRRSFNFHILDSFYENHNCIFRVPWDDLHDLYNIKKLLGSKKVLKNSSNWLIPSLVTLLLLGAILKKLPNFSSKNSKSIVSEQETNNEFVNIPKEKIIKELVLIYKNIHNFSRHYSCFNKAPTISALVNQVLTLKAKKQTNASQPSLNNQPKFVAKGIMNILLNCNASCKKSLMQLINLSNYKDKTFSDYFLNAAKGIYSDGNQEENTSSLKYLNISIIPTFQIKKLIEWISFKFFFAMHLRFKIENILTEALPHTEWKELKKIKHIDFNEIITKIKSTQKKIYKILVKINSKIHFINHFELIPIFEFPTYKLFLYLNNAQEIIKINNLDENPSFELKPKNFNN